MCDTEADVYDSGPESDVHVCFLASWQQLTTLISVGLGEKTIVLSTHAVRRRANWQQHAA